jgi:hypothetical protein
MFQVHADSLESYLSFDPERRQDLEKLNALIRQAAPNLRRYFHKGTPAGEPGMRMKMIGYGKFSYAVRSGKSTSWPVIGVALQRNYISVYVSVTKGGVPIVLSYRGTLGESRMGRNNFSFERFEDLQVANVFELCREVGRVFQADPQNPVRFKQAAIEA